MKITTLTAISVLAILTVACSEKPEDKARREATEECKSFVDAYATPREKEDKEGLQEIINDCIEDNVAKRMREINRSSNN